MVESNEPNELERGIALARQGQREAAYAGLRQALFAQGDSATLRLWLASVAPSPAESTRHLQRAQALEPGNREVAAALNQAQELSDPTPAATLVWPDASTPWSAPELDDLSGLPAWAVEAPATARPATGGPPGEREAAPDPPQPHTVLDTLPRAPVGTPAAEPADPATLVTPPPYGVFAEALGDLNVPPGGVFAPAEPEAAGPAEVAPPPAATPPSARRRGLPWLLGALALLALCGLVGLALNTGLLSVARTPPRPASTRAASPAAGALAPLATATAAVDAQATRTAAPAATARAAARAYHDAVTPLLNALLAEDGEIANIVHGADNGVIAAPTAGRRLDDYLHENAKYQARAANLDAPVASRPHALQVQTGVTLRGQALNFAAQYVAKLGDLAGASATLQDAQRSFDDALAAYNHADTQARYTDLLRARQDLDTASSQLARLHTYADQNQQQFQTAWDRYHATLPAAPPP